MGQSHLKGTQLDDGDTRLNEEDARLGEEDLLEMRARGRRMLPPSRVRDILIQPPRGLLYILTADPRSPFSS